MVTNPTMSHQVDCLNETVLLGWVYFSRIESWTNNLIPTPTETWVDKFV